MEPDAETRPQNESTGQVSRRTVLKWGGVTTAGLVLVGGIAAEELGVIQLAAPGSTPADRVVARAEDGLVNLGVLPARLLGPGPRLELINSSAPGYVVLGFQPQAVAEQAYFNATTAPALPVPAVASGPSRVVPRVAPGSPPMPYDLPTLVNLAAFPPATNSVADGGSAYPPPPPGPTDTAIEAPWRLFLSPRRPRHSALPVPRSPVTGGPNCGTPGPFRGAPTALPPKDPERSRCARSGRRTCPAARR